MRINCWQHMKMSYCPWFQYCYAAVTIHELFMTPGEAWHLEDEEEGKMPLTSCTSGHVDEALFASRLPRHYFHSSHTHSTPSHSQAPPSTGSHKGRHIIIVKQ